MKCIFCGNEDYILLNDTYMIKNIATSLPLEFNEDKVSKYRIKVDVCKKCGLGINTTPPTTEELIETYEHYFYPSSFFDGITMEWFTKVIKNEMKRIIKHVNKDSKIVEIGCHDGSLLYMLQEEGYNNVMGIEPSKYADKGIAHGVNIQKDFFKEGYFKDEKIDMFILRHVFEHFENPFSIFKNMVDQLDDNGKIYIETPNFTYYSYVHTFFYSWFFYERMAHKYNMKIIECVENFDLDIISVVFAKKDTSYEEQKCPYTLEYIIEREQKAISKREKELNDNLEKLKEYLKDKEEVYWWGTRYTASVYLDKLSYDQDIKCKIYPIDSQQRRQGYKLPKCYANVVLPTDIENTHKEGIVIAAGAIDEIKDSMKKHNITADSIFHLL